MTGNCLVFFQVKTVPFCTPNPDHAVVRLAVFTYIINTLKAALTQDQAP